MAPRTVLPSPREQRIAASLRRKALDRVREIGDLDKVASLLDAPTVGVESLLARDPWDLVTAFRVAESLEIDVTEALEMTAAQ